MTQHSLTPETTPTKQFPAGSDCSVNSSVSGSTNTPGSHKKRSRRRRKGKSRSKVEPLSSASSPMASPSKKGSRRSNNNNNKSAFGRSSGASVSSAYSYGGGSSVTTAITNNTHNNNNNSMSCAGSITSVNSKKHHDAPMTKRDIYFALDCEMVGVGPDGLTSAVGRVSVVNWENQTVLDTYVKVPVPVTDYRTHVSGITAEHLQESNNDKSHSLMSFDEVRTLVETILRGKILIGHGLENDLKVLGLSHPWSDIRDTATYSYFMREATPSTMTHYQQQHHFPSAVPNINGGLAPKKLRDLAWEQLGRQIQCPGVPHSPMEDAIAALDLYKKVRGQWEDHLIKLSREQEQEQQKQKQLMEQRQQQQLMELQQQQLLERQRQHHQQQQQQARRWQWLASNSNNQRGAFPLAAAPSAQHPFLPDNMQMQQPRVPLLPQDASYSLRPPIAPVMTMASPSPAALAFLQQHEGPATPSTEQSAIYSTNNAMRTSSSWFGFSRRNRARGGFPQHQSHQQDLPQTPPPASSRRDFNRQTSRESMVTQCTMAMAQSSFDGDSYSPSQTIRSTSSQDCEGFPSSSHGTWQVPDDFGVEEEVDVDQMRELGEEAGASMMDTLDPTLSGDQSEIATVTSATAASETETSVAALPTDYEPPRYFANPEPEERLSSSSWFKLWGSSSSRKQQDSSSKSCGYNSDAEAEDSPEKPTGLFKSRLFPRRASESCMCGDTFLDEKKKGCSRSMHG